MSAPRNPFSYREVRRLNPNFLYYSLNFLIIPNKRFGFFFFELKTEIRGRWSDPSNWRYWDRPLGKRSDQELLARVLSRRQCTQWVPLCPLHESKLPECLISKRSQEDKNVLKLENELSGLSIPPDFSTLEVISLKSPVRNHGESLGAAMLVSEFHTSCLK